MRTQRGGLGILTTAGLTLILVAASAEARISRIEITERESPMFEGRTFGDVGQYEKIRGKMYGEADPSDRLNAVIVNIEKATSNSRGMVEYVTDFLMLKPVDMRKGNGKIFYTINNRGNTGVRSLTDSTTGGNNPTAAADAGNGFTMREGYTLFDAGWEGDVLPGNFRLTVELPVATDGGREITAPILVEFHDLCLPLIRPIGSRRSPEVFVMEPTHAGHLHHTALARRLHPPWLGCVLGQR